MDFCFSCYSSLSSFIRSANLGLIDLNIYERTLKGKDATMENSPSSN